MAKRTKKTHIVLPVELFYKLVAAAKEDTGNYLKGTKMINLDEHNGLLKSVIADIGDALTGDWDCSNIENNDVRDGFKLIQKQLKKSLIKPVYDNETNG